MEATYRVEGMTCGGCARSVTGAILYGRGDLKVDVSVEGNTVTVHGDHDEEAIRVAVEGAGYEFGGRTG